MTLAELLPVGPGPITAGALMAALGWAVLRGWLIPRPWHRERVNDWRELADRWEKIAEKERAINETYGDATKELLDHARTSTRILTALQEHRDRGAR